jgi:hypothetical protein
VLLPGAVQQLGFQFVECGVEVGDHSHCVGPLGVCVLAPQHQLEILNRRDHPRCAHWSWVLR